MADINLLQNQLKDTTLISARRTKIVAWLGFIILLVIIGTSLWLNFSTQQINSQTADVTNSNNKLQAQLSGQKNGLVDAESYQAQLTNLKLLLKNHIAFSPLIDELAKYTYQKAVYSVFDIAEDTGKVHVEGTVDSYNGLGDLLLGLSTSPDFSGVTLLAVNQGTGAIKGFTFSIDMLVAPNAFIKTQ